MVRIPFHSVLEKVKTMAAKFAIKQNHPFSLTKRLRRPSLPSLQHSLNTRNKWGCIPTAYPLCLVI